MKELPEFPEEYVQLSKVLFKPRERLRAYRAFFEAGVLHALLDALTLCRELSSVNAATSLSVTDNEDADMNGHRSVPLWVLEGALSLAQHRISTGAATGKKGPHANELNEMRDRQTHLVRYLLVRKEVELGKNIPDACFAISEALLNSEYAGAEETISKSYNTVTKALKTKADALRYYAGWRRLAWVAVNANNDGS